jgi:hypothetical protein
MSSSAGTLDSNKPALGLFSWYIYENVASWQGGVHRVYDRSNIDAQHRPLLVAKDHNSDFAALQVLLVNEILVGR